MGSHGIFILAVQVTLPIIRDNNSRHFAVHPKMRVCVAHEHQQLHRIVSPANPVLMRGIHLHEHETQHQSNVQVEKYLCKLSHPTHRCLHDGIKTTLWNINVC